MEADEPERVAAAARAMALNYVVLTSTTRDDLPDGGASHYVATTIAVKRVLPSARLEVLVPDFDGQAAAVDRLLAAPVDVIAHNVETVPRLYRTVRPGATYRRSLDVLKRARGGGKLTKSSLLVGLGESAAEVDAVLRDLRGADVAIVTLGQYLRPGPAQLAVTRYWEPAAFERWEATAGALGFAGVASGPFVRSSYRAAELYLAAARRFDGAAS